MLDSNVQNYFLEKTVLIVEDHYQTRELLKSTLEMLFKKVLIATDGVECIEQIKNQQLDLIITDLQMPFKSGIECIEEIRTQNNQIPIIIISAYSDEDYLLKAANLDIQGYLLKPLDIEVLESTLTKIHTLAYPNKIFIINEELTYDYENSVIIFNGVDIRLTKKENDYLKILVDNINKIVSYDELEYNLWGKNGEVMSINSLRTLVKKLRAKLPINIIKNISKTGYKLDLP